MHLELDAHSYVPLFVNIMTPIQDSENQMIYLIYFIILFLLFENAASKVEKTKY